MIELNADQTAAERGRRACWVFENTQALASKCKRCPRCRNGVAAVQNGKESSQLTRRLLRFDAESMCRRADACMTLGRSYFTVHDIHRLQGKLAQHAPPSQRRSEDRLRFEPLSRVSSRSALGIQFRFLV